MNGRKGGDILCLMDLEEVMVVGEGWDLDFGGALPLGLMLVWEEEDCRGVGTSSVEQRGYLGHGQCRKLKPIDNDTHCMIYCHQMGDDIRAKLAELQDKGWTLANIACKISQAKRTVESWNQGKRSPGNLQSVLASLDKLSEQKRIPKKKIYSKGKLK